MNRRGKVATVFSFVILALAVLWFIVSGAAALMKSGAVSLNYAEPNKLCEFSSEYSMEAFEVKNTVNLIPVGKEHYYLMIADEDIAPMLVRAKPSWIEKHFYDDGTPKGGSVTIKGNVTRLNYEITKEVREMNSDLVKKGIADANAVSTNYYIDVRYKEFGALRLFSGIGLVIVGAVFFLGVKSGALAANKALRFILAIPTIAVALLLIYTTSMSF